MARASVLVLLLVVGSCLAEESCPAGESCTTQVDPEVNALLQSGTSVALGKDTIADEAEEGTISDEAEEEELEDAEEDEPEYNQTGGLYLQERDDRGAESMRVVNTVTGCHRRRDKTAVKQCVKNKAGISFTLKAFNQDGKKMYQENNFLYGEEYCHKSCSEGNFRTFDIQSNACDVARGFAQVGAGAAVVVAFTAGAILSGGTTVAAQVAGGAILGLAGITTMQIQDAILNMPRGELDGLVLLPGNMKKGQGRLKLTGNCVKGVEVEGR